MREPSPWATNFAYASHVPLYRKTSKKTLIMAVNLEMHNGLIKEYPTTYELYDGIGECVSSTTVSMCNISGSTKCDHLYCAIYAAKETAKNNKSFFKIYLIAGLFWFLMPEFSVLGLILGLMCALFGIYSIWQSKKYEKMARDLMEFRDHGSINGIVAHKLLFKPVLI